MKSNTIYEANKNYATKILITSLVAFCYGLHCLFEGGKGFSFGNAALMSVGILCIAAGFYALYASHVIRSQYVKFENGTVTGLGLQHGFPVRSRSFTFGVFDLQGARTVSLRYIGTCIELDIRGQGPILVMLPDPENTMIDIVDTMTRQIYNV